MLTIKKPDGCGNSFSFDNWKKTISDLVSINYDFIYFHESKRIIKLKIPNENKQYFTEIEDRLADGIKLSITYEPAKEHLSSERVWKKFKENSLCTSLKKENFESVLANILERTIAETNSGYQTFFLILGVLSWSEDGSDSIHKQITSPLIFVPLEIRRSEDIGYHIFINERSSGVNTILLERLKEDYGIEFPEIKDTLPKDAHGLDVQKILEYIDNTVYEVHSEWEVKYSAYLGHLANKYPKFEDWKLKLLNLADNNYDLLNFRESKRTLKIQVPDDKDLEFISRLEDELSKGKIFSFNSVPEKEPISTEKIQTKFKDKTLYENLKKNELESRLLEIFKHTQLSNEESGVSTLFLSLGMLKRSDSKNSKKLILSPLIFIPLEISRQGLSNFQIYRGDDESRVNVTLISKLKEDLGLEFPLIKSQLPTDEHGIDIPQIMNHFREIISNHDDTWIVENTACIGHFSYTKYLMWKDLDEMDVDILINKNNFFAKLVNPERHQYFDDINFPSESNIDETFLPQDIFTPISADSSQLSAIISAGLGKSFVLHGPPGTGKSQTITNIIAHCLANNRTVLFVSEKKVALDVVYNRLKECGLAPFCLELHSNKSSKRNVLDQLNDTLEYSKNNRSKDWISKCNELYKVKEELNKYVSAIHSPHTTGESYFYGISQLAKLRNTEPIKFKGFTYAKLSNSELELRRKCVNQLKNSIKIIGYPPSNPWNPARISEWKPQHRDVITNTLTNLKDSSNKLSKYAISTYNVIFQGCKNVNPNMNDFITIIKSLYRTKYHIPFELLSYSDFESCEGDLHSLLSIGRERDELREQVLQKYQPEVLNLEIEELVDLISQNNFLKNILALNRAKNYLKPFALKPIKNNSELISDINLIHELSKKQIELDENDEAAETLFGIEWNKGNPSWNNLEEIIVSTKNLRCLVCTDSKNIDDRVAIYESWSKILKILNSDSENAKKIKTGFNGTVNSFNNTKKLLEEISIQLKISHVGTTEEEQVHQYLDRIEKKVDIWKESINQLNDWCHYQEIRKNCIDNGLEELIYLIESKQTSPIEIQEIFDRSYYQWWIEQIRSNDPIICKFYRPDHETTIQHLHTLDDEYQKLARDQIISILTTHLPEDNGVGETEIEILKRQIKKKRNNISVRSLFQNISKILPKLKPCMLMSPISVSQYLILNDNLFDLVIFDEASQIPIWDAIGAIVRGKQVIVVGDPMQMPPTNFYQRVAEGTEGNDNLLVNLENILDDCIASRIPEIHLKWHYRSRHESLIAFSNYHFYKNNLRTFPSTHKESAVTLRRISGIYDSGSSGSNTNKDEAEAVVKEILARLSNSETSKDSIGIVTFNQAQRDLIDELLENEKRNNPQLITLLNKDDSNSLFIKNLESVQGDERDVIFFSVGYGPDNQGKVSMNFGPLNKEGGERRLNVAITRARKEIVVFSSLYPEHMNLANVEGKGARLLKSFLEYAEHGIIHKRGTEDEPDGEPESPFEEEVGNILLRMGYEIHYQVGCGGYRIDIGVVDPKNPGRYLLGVECDGAQYHRFKAARDRDRLREEVLIGLGWTIHRIWSTDWWENQIDEINRMEVALDRAKMSELNL